MTAISWFDPLGVVAASTGFYSDGMYFDLSNPKIRLGLLIGGAIPYFLPAIPAAFTKWFILASVFKARPKASRIVLVAVLEPLCFMGLTALLPNTLFPLWPNLSENPLMLLILLVLVMLPNFLLVSPRDQSGQFGYHFPRRILCVLAVGLVYWAYVVLVALALSMWLAFAG